MPQGPVAQAIHRKLTEAFAPERLELVDDSWKHAGHHHEGGIDARPGGESHFNLLIVASAFEGVSRLERQRRINAALREELSGPLHALSIQARTPQEAG
ncbi:BolA family protein [Brevundimonas balnearis]|uniref:BolA family protein n=1 Tax=Brevundimonas balnearis TaxID=1572858 RepID=A0ABV6QYZ8_9CAUL